MKVVAPVQECQLQTELLKGEEHVGVWRDSTLLGFSAGRDFTKLGSSLGGGWLWLQGQGLLPWLSQSLSLNAEEDGAGLGWMGWGTLHVWDRAR